VITHAFLIQRKAGPLPTVRGADAVEKAFWMPLEDIDVQKDMVFDDHVQIIQLFSIPTATKAAPGSRTPPSDLTAMGPTWRAAAAKTPSPCSSGCRCSSRTA